MIKDNQKYLNRLHVIVDAVTIACMYMLAWFIKFVIMEQPENVGSLPLQTYFTAMIAIVPGYLVLYNECNLYTPKRGTQTRYEFFNIVKANLMGAAVIMMLLYVAKLIHFSREMLLIFFVLNVFTSTLTRRIIRKILRFVRKKGYNLKHILLVGYSRAAEGYVDRIMENPEWGYHICGILDDKVPRGTVYKGIKVLGSIDNLHYILPENKLDEIAVTLSLINYDRLEEIVNFCEKSGVHTKFIPDYNSIIPSRPYTEDILGLPVINIRYVPLTNTFNWMLKRVMDVVGSIFGIVISSPVMLISAILVKCTSRGPIIFKQQRIGYHNKPFMMYKFRTMQIQKETVEKKGWTTPNDPRVTRIGRFLRKTSLDELPQLFNILRGDMSLVGPRPERPQFVEKFKEEIPRYMVKHQVRPGLTGWAQVNGYRGDTSIVRRVEFDIYYIENWSLSFDIKILFLTFFKGFINKNAY
ncbi:MAG: undecaprenyl-phosphate glucose phosphotransferase [Lachnospiraceae bacterium]|nr:undecaprenyl-phosphate glucose phosphotransferase [Lachnospiraceae bacterium]